MYWINADQLRNSEDVVDQHSQQHQSQQLRKPTKRWGQSCVSANNKLYIIGGYEGQYLGDVWEYDFVNMQYTQIALEGQDAQLLSRSNHTAVFHEQTNSIYVFGGGHTQRQRFNDTIKLEFVEQTTNVRGSQQTQKVLKVEKLQLAENSPLPSARTYHASCLLGKYMIVVGGESNSDLADLWALDLEQKIWYKPEIDFKDTFTPKRFHSVSTLNDTKVITFGGCHSEYVHMNEMHTFDLADFLENPNNIEKRVVCNQIKVTQGVPTTRWGHASATYQQKLYVIGGRNDKDVNDIHEFDYETMKWKELELQGPLPMPRRRHSALFISGSIVLFGGFDGNFYDDLHILDFQTYRKQIINIQPSTISMDYRSMVGEQEKSDLTFVLDTKSGLNQRIYAHKPLILFRLVQREIITNPDEYQRLDYLISKGKVCDFIKKVYEAKQGQEIPLKNITCKYTMLKFLEYLYCDKFVDQTTTSMVKKVAEVCKELGLTQTYMQLKKKADFATMKINQGVIQELQQRSPNNEPLVLSKSQQQVVKNKVEQLEQQVKLDFSHIEDMAVLSPEDRQERLHNKALHHMNQCKNLDEFFDVLFLVEDTLIKANSLVLSARCPYFKSMLSRNYQFRESKVDKNGYIKVEGVPKLYFSCIIQYIYSDHFYIQKQDSEFFVKLMIYADYFSLPRLVDICSSYLKQYVNVKSAILLFLLAHAHNASQLEKYCINYIAMNEFEIMNSRHFRNFKRQAQSSLIQVFFDRLNEEKESSFVQISIQNYLNKKNNSLIEQQYSNTEQYPTNDLVKKISVRQLSQGAQQKQQQQSQQQHQPFNLLHNKKQYCSQKDEEEVESKLLDLLNNSPYIYLEEHQNYESYSNICQKLSQLEEQKEIVNEFNEFSYTKQKVYADKFLFNKENMNPNTSSSKSKLFNLQKNMLSDQNMDSNQFGKKSNMRRQPLKDLGDQNVDDINYDDQSDFENFSTMACSNNYSNNLSDQQHSSQNMIQQQSKNQQTQFIPKRSQFYNESNVSDTNDVNSNNMNSNLYESADEQ